MPEMAFTKYPSDTFDQLARNAGVLLTDFDPSGSGGADTSAILFPTSGGINFTDKPNFVDLGANIDNVPKNTAELKMITDRTVTITGTAAGINPTSAAYLAIANGSTDSTAPNGEITPTDLLESGHFKTLWFVCDYSSHNSGSGAGFIAIELKNVLSTGGFAVQTTDQGNGTFSFEFTAHYSISNPDEVPYRIIVKTGTSGA